MDGWGGYREPRNPAPVSGPGALSRRTDGQGVRRLPDAAYGESAEFEAIQAGAPMAEAQTVDTSRVVPLGAPTSHPERPVTDGAPLGPGDSELPSANDDLMQARKYLPVLKFIASQPHASNATRQLVRQLAATAQQ